MVNRLIIDGHDVYEIDENCMKQHETDSACELLEKIKKSQNTDETKNQRAR